MSSSVAIACTLSLALVQDPRPPVDRPPEAAAAQEFERAGAEPPADTTPPASDTTVEGPAEGPVSDAEVAANSDSDRAETNAVAPPKWKGNGLLITSGVLGAIGLGANIGRIAVVQRLCKEVAYDPDSDAIAGTDRCQNEGAGLVLLGAGAVAFNVAAIGTGAAGGSLHGSWAAHDTAVRNGRLRAAGAQIGVGAGLLAIGVLGYVAVRVASFADALGASTCGDRHPVDPMASDQANSELTNCVRNRWSGYLGGIAATQAAAVAGTGILAHGVSYSRNLKLYRTITSHQVDLRPIFAPTWAGVGVSARF